MSDIRRLMYRIHWYLERKIVPGERSSQYEYRDAVEAAIGRGGAWLDLGCGHQIFGAWMQADETRLTSYCSRVVGIDGDFASVRGHRSIRDRLAGRLEQLPFADSSFDLVTANMVVEHLGDPARVLEEIRRILKPAGRLVFHTPNRNAMVIRISRMLSDPLKKKLAWLLERRRANDVYPTFYRFNTEADMRKIAGACGLHVDEVRYVNTSAATAVFGPLSIPELLYARITASPRFPMLRPDIVVILRKPEEAPRHGRLPEPNALSVK